jgi:hypothetical protein
MIGWIALSSTRLWGKRGEDGLSKIVFAAFFSVEVPESSIPAATYANARMLE